MSAGILTAAAIRLFTDMAIPGWATNVSGFLLVIMSQALILSFVAIFVSAANRDVFSVIEPEAYKLLIASVTSFDPQNGKLGA